MIDWHSHVLPCVDDGSESIDESLAMLKSMAESGIETVIATPHFYANDESVDEFIAKRDKAASELLAVHGENMPRIICGAEVKYYSGIARMKGLERLCIGSSRLLLLEMPMTKWTEYTVKELIELTCSKRLKVVLAHTERYLSLQSEDVIEKLLENGICIQTNASFFLKLFTKGRALRMIDDEMIQFIGSDCHNMTTRPPNADKAYELIEKKLGRRFVERMIAFGYDMLE